MFDRPLIVHTRDHVCEAFCAANSLGVNLTLQSAPGAIFYAGLLYLKMMVHDVAKTFPKQEYSYILDCGDDASLALEAMRSGIPFIRIEMLPSIEHKVKDAAHQFSVKCLTSKFRALDLAHHRDVRSACLEWLAEQTA